MSRHPRAPGDRAARHGFAKSHSAGAGLAARPGDGGEMIVVDLAAVAKMPDPSSPLEAGHCLRYELDHDDACGTEQLVVGSLLGGLDHACALEINKPPGTSRSGGFLFDPPDLGRRNGPNGVMKWARLYFQTARSGMKHAAGCR